MYSLKSIWVGCVLCVRLFCWENRQTDSANCRPFRLSPVFVILKRLTSFFITCAILRYTECRKHSLYRFRGTSMPSRPPPLPEAVYMGFSADDRGRTGTGISSHGILSPRVFASSATSAYLSTTYGIIPYFLTLVKTFVMKKIKEQVCFITDLLDLSFYLASVVGSGVSFG